MPRFTEATIVYSRKKTRLSFMSLILTEIHLDLKLVSRTRMPPLPATPPNAPAFSPGLKSSCIACLDPGSSPGHQERKPHAHTANARLRALSSSRGLDPMNPPSLTGNRGPEPSPARQERKTHAPAGVSLKLRPRPAMIASMASARSTSSILMAPRATRISWARRTTSTWLEPAGGSNL